MKKFTDKKVNNKQISNFKVILWAIIFLIIGYFLNQYLFSILNWLFSFLVII
ncbi:hypothetical protein MCEME33_00098 [Candidatus Pelagibacterales bacterium]